MGKEKRKKKSLWQKLIWQMGENQALKLNPRRDWRIKVFCALEGVQPLGWRAHWGWGQWSWVSSVWSSWGNWRLSEAGGGEGRQRVQALLLRGWPVTRSRMDTLGYREFGSLIMCAGIVLIWDGLEFYILAMNNRQERSQIQQRGAEKPRCKILVTKKL